MSMRSGVISLPSRRKVFHMSTVMPSVACEIAFIIDIDEYFLHCIQICYRFLLITDGCHLLAMASLRYLPFLSPDGLEGGGVLGIFGNSRCCSLSILFLFRWRRWRKPTCSGQLILISRLSWSVNHLRMIGRIIACRFV